MKYVIAVISLFFPLAGYSQAYDTIRIATYNVLYFDKGEEERLVPLRDVLRALDADVLFVQETTVSSPDFGDGQEHFLADVAQQVNSNYGSDAVVVPAQDTYVMLLYDREKFDYTGSSWVFTEPRLSFGTELRLKATGDTILFFTLDLHEGETQTDRNLRSDATNEIRDSLASQYKGKKIILGGSFNVYDSAEVAYSVLTRPRKGDTLFVDPVVSDGYWSDNPASADLHTFSTRVRSFGGGAGGGLRHRFDQILVSRTLQGNYLPGSYTTFGNDGNHFGDSINAGTNTAVSAEIANALHAASDHLPVYLDLVFNRISTGVPNEVGKRQGKGQSCPDLY